MRLKNLFNIFKRKEYRDYFQDVYKINYPIDENIYAGDYVILANRENEIGVPNKQLSFGFHKGKGNPKKIDPSKPDMSLIPPIIMYELSKTLEVGAKKYGAFSWRRRNQNVRTTVLIAAMYRHLTLYNGGEDFDEDGQHHLIAIMGSCAILRDQEFTNNQFDDREKLC